MNDAVGDAVEIHLQRDDDMHRHAVGQVRQGTGLAVDNERRVLWIDIDDRAAGIIQGELVVDRVHRADAGVDFLIGDIDGGHGGRRLVVELQFHDRSDGNRRGVDRPAVIVDHGIRVGYGRIEGVRCLGRGPRCGQLRYWTWSLRLRCPARGRPPATATCAVLWPLSAAKIVKAKSFVVPCMSFALKGPRLLPPELLPS